MSATIGPAFLGRTSERDVLDGLLTRVRGGESEVMVLRGEAGVGKTALLRYAARQASGFRVAQISGVESEMELPYAGLHQLYDRSCRQEREAPARRRCDAEGRSDGERRRRRLA